MSKTTDIINAINLHLKSETLKTADDEVYKGGYWPTGLLPIDAVLMGGQAKGRHSLMAGESATLKSLIALSTVAQVQRQGGVAALVDAEHAFDQKWAEELGINLSELILQRPETGEEAIDTIELLARAETDFIAVDSIAALLPKAERDIMLSGGGNVQPARIAALMSVGLRRINAANKVSAIQWISQLRDNIGAMAFSPKTNVTGGKSIHYYISQSLMLKKTGKFHVDKPYFDGEKDQTDKQIVAQKFRVESVKTRFGQPFQLQHFTFDLINGQIDLAGYLISQGLYWGDIVKKGAHWTYTVVDSDGVVLAEHKAGSKDKFKELVESDPVIVDGLLDLVCRKYNLTKENYTWKT